VYGVPIRLTLVSPIAGSNQISAEAAPLVQCPAVRNVVADSSVPLHRRSRLPATS
jgi:hypothetical protein